MQTILLSFENAIYIYLELIPANVTSNTFTLQIYRDIMGLSDNLISAFLDNRFVQLR